jgi:YegS/Rv2252/BmrU family lipid kinase
VAEILRKAGMELEVSPTSGPEAASQLAKEAARQDRDVVLVCGGDGTLNEVINGLAGSQVPLGLLPGGTANMLAREVGLPLDPVRAATELARWSPRRIPLGKATWCSEKASIDGAPAEKEQAIRYFMTVAGIGFDAHVVYKLSTEMKLSWGVAGYIMEALRQAFRYPFQGFSCRTDDGPDRIATFATAQRAGNYGGWLRLTPDARFFDDRFNLCFFKSHHRARYFLYAALVLARQHFHLGDVELVEARKLCCDAQVAGETVRFELDGELVGTLPATFEIVPDALTLLVPERESRNSKFENRNSKFENRNWKLETGKAKLEIRNSKLEARKSKVENGNWKLASLGSKSETENWKVEN